MTTLLAFHGDPAIKARFLARVRAHRATDDIIRGTYGCAGGTVSGWRGCAVGCTIHGNSHAAYESELGIPQALGHMEDTLFERMPVDAAMDWPVEFLDVIPVGADLSLVVWQLLERGIRDLLRFSTDATRPAMQRVIDDVLAPMARGEATPNAVAEAARATIGIARATIGIARPGGIAAYAAAYAAARAAECAARAAAYSARAGYAAGYAASAAEHASAAGAQMAFRWSRWLLEFMAAAPVPATDEVTR